ncbi:hypothetical protein LOTGIDRAFT_162445 [Lottia gigantea]|uniref:Uncharacterized protein n=1 Tax=Lottia gigantea TaxID=225164 RepID=V4BU50_LOTGI|nr:hypothetical protein LOTGIDRAFT_162445 [Lottia gigantea]ESO92539.1 hypothetical protein LOTGIDRAFT_162445 [Lottia gigantea]
MPPDALLNLCASYIGKMGPCLPNNYFEELPREVLERLIEYMCAETLNRIKPLIDRYKLTEVSEIYWRHHLSGRFWGMERSTWFNGSITDEFLETRNISNHQLYMNKHFNSICSWLLDDHLHGFSEDPYKVFRSPIRTYRKTQNLANITDEDKKLDLKNIIKHVTKFSLHGRYCSQFLEESYILHLLIQSITHLEVSLVCDNNFKSVIKTLRLFMSAGKITNISLCQILVSDAELLRQLLGTCAGICDDLNPTELQNNFITGSDSSCSDSDSESDLRSELDLLDEALIPDKQRNKPRKICHKILDLSRRKCEVTSLSFNKYDNLEMINVLADIFPSWTYLKQLSVYGLADKDTDRRLIRSILPLIQTQQLTHLCLNLLLPEAGNLALVFNELIKSYSSFNISYDRSKYLEVLAITPFQSISGIETNITELKRFQNLQIPGVCNIAKRMKLHTGLFNIRSVGQSKLYELLQANHILEDLDLEVHCVKTSEQLIHLISNSNWQLKRLCLQDSLSKVTIDGWINLIRKKITLTNLSLSHTLIDLSDSKGKQALIILEAILQGDNHIECLDITYNQISLQTIYNFLTDLSQKPIKHKLRELYMAENIVDYDNVRVQEVSREIFKITKTFVGEGIMRLTMKNGAHNMVEYEAVM